MGVKIQGQQTGELKMKMIHEYSGAPLETDPPLDNGGSASSFSPTDLVATGLGSCMMSVMAIFAKKQGWPLSGMKCSVEKHMSVDLPRRISKLEVQIWMPRSLSQEQRDALEKIGNGCPVIQSLHPSIGIQKQYHYEKVSPP